MNTSKQVNVMIGLMFVFLIGTLLYFLWDDVRADDASEKQIAENAERGGALFATNCRSCHGLNGRGTLENPNLPGLPLNDSGINRPDDPGKLLERQARVLDTIRCGRVGTLMPQWAEDQGGPLNDFQILQLVTLITGAMPDQDPPDDPNAVSELGWEAALEEADHADLLEGKKLTDAVGATNTTFILTNAQGFTIDGLLRIDGEVVKIVDAPANSTLEKRIDAEETELPVKRAGELFKADNTVQIGNERMHIISVSGDTLTVERGVEGTEAAEHRVEATVFEPGDRITVERGAFGTEAGEHEAGTQLFAGPIEPPMGPLVGEDGTPPCGQRAPAPAAPSTPAETVTIEGQAAVEMGDNFFSLNDQRNPNLSVKVGQEITIDLTNGGANPHNMHLTGADDTFEASICETGGDEPCSDPNQINGGGSGVITFTLDQAGTFGYRCDFHPVEMVGEIVVTE